FGGESQAAVVVKITLLGAQCSGWIADDALEFSFLCVVQGIAYFHLILLCYGMVDFEADVVAVVSFMSRTSFVVAHVIGVIEPDQGLVQGEIDCQRRTQFKAPTFLLIRPDRGRGVVIVEASQRARDGPGLGLFLRRKARRISSLHTGGTERS